MTLIKSISGIRGTIGGPPGNALTPVDIVKYAAAFGTWILSRKGKKVVIGRDARISGEMVNALVTSTLQGLGLDVEEARGVADAAGRASEVGAEVEQHQEVDEPTEE